MSAAPSNQPFSEGKSGGHLDSTIGALFFATVISMGLWGAGTLQLCFYYTKYPKDSTRLKSYVFAVWFLDTSHQALLVGMAHNYLIAGFGDYESLMQLDVFLMSAFPIGGLICAMVQFMFIMRIWRLSEKNLFIAIFTGTLVVAQFGAAYLYFVKALQSKTFAKLMGAMTITRVVNSVTAAADTTIAICLIVLLHRSRSGFKQTDNAINRLILFTINTGLVTSLCAVLGLVLGFVYFETLLFMIFYLMIARLYTNCLLAALNSRNGLRGSFVNATRDSRLSTKERLSGMFSSVTFRTNLDKYNPPPSVASPSGPGGPQERSPRSGVSFGCENSATRMTAMLGSGLVVVDGRHLSDGSIGSHSVYSIDLQGFEAVPSDESSPKSSPTKAYTSNSTDDWI